MALDRETDEAVNNSKLENLEPGSLSETFKSLTETNRAELQAFHPTLVSVSNLVGKLQNIGLDQVGIALASHDSLRELNLVSKGKIADTAYMILSIYQTRYLVRVKPGNIIDCHPDNLNKYHGQKNDLSSDEFWYRDKGKEARFFQYDLSQADDCISFVTTILQTASICAAEDELRQFDRPAEGKATLSKQSRGLK